MVNNNNNINQYVDKKPFEIVQEVNNEIPSFEEFMKSYEEGVNYDDLNGSDVGTQKGYGPCTDGRNWQNCHCSQKELQKQLSLNSNITSIENVTNIIVLRFPRSANRLFRLQFMVFNTSSWGRVAVFHDVKEVIRSANIIVTGEKDNYYGHDWRDEGCWWFGSRSLTSSLRSSAAIALQSVVQHYQEGNEINGWLRVEERSFCNPLVTWDYSCGVGRYNPNDLENWQQAS